ncbi:MAG: InlB B-repeat-containing protein [Bacillota bacterium]|nr:InlB B-repeat-containing protein [Bacillota bacterium]
MKRMFKLIAAIIMALTMLPTNFVFARDTSALSDVTGSEYYADAANALAQLGILKGYEDGTFGAERTVTRAEMAAVVCRMMDYKETANKAKGKAEFVDVDEGHWATGYINTAVEKGIISGDGNGNFRPDDEVLYEEAVKMVVCALGYGEEAEKAGGWKDGYLSVAKNKGISDKLKGAAGKAITRGDIALMVYNGITENIGAPIASVKSGTYTEAQSVTLTCETPNAVIYYTTDGSEPTVKSTKYTKAISVSKTMALKAVAVKDGVLVSRVMSSSYTIKLPEGGGGGGGSSSTTKYTVSFNLNYTKAPSSIPSQSVNKNALAAQPADPVREGYLFDGWYKDANCTQAADFTLEITVNVTFYAKWEKMNIVSFDLNYEGAVNNISSQSVKVGELATQPADPVRAGYTFLGWHDVESGGTTAFDFHTNIVKNIQLYSYWVSSAEFLSDNVETIDGNKITYFKSHTETATSTATLDDTINYTYNIYDSGTVGFADFIEKHLYNGSYGNGNNIELRDTDNNGKYDYAIITSYSYLAVDYVTVSSDMTYTIMNRSDMSVSTKRKIIIEKNSLADIKIYKDGKEINPDGLEQYDILNIIATDDCYDGAYLLKGIIYVTHNAVTGTVKYNDTEDRSVTLLDNSVYRYNEQCLWDDESLVAQADIRAFLNVYGEIVYIDTQWETYQYSYGYASYVTLNGPYSDYSAAYIRLADKSGGWSTMPFASSVIVYNESEDGDIIKISSEAEYAFETEYTGIVDYLKAETSFSTTKVVVNSMIAYKTDAEGNIKKIAIGFDAISDMVGSYTTKDYSWGLQKYEKNDDSTYTLGAYDIDDSTVVFNVAAEPEIGVEVKEDDLAVMDKYVFTDDGYYSGELYSIKNNIAGYVFGYGFKPQVNWQSDFFVVSDVSSESLDNKNVIKLTGIQSEERVTYYVDSNSIVSDTTNDKYDYATYGSKGLTEISDFKKGQIILLLADTKNIIRRAVIVSEALANENEINIENVKKSFVSGTEGRCSLNEGFVVGVYGNEICLDKDTTLKNTYFDAEDSSTYNPDHVFDVSEGIPTSITDPSIAISNKTLVTVCDFTKSENNIYSGSVSDIKRGTVLFGKSNAQNEFTEVVVFITNDTEKWVDYLNVRSEDVESFDNLKVTYYKDSAHTDAAVFEIDEGITGLYNGTTPITIDGAGETDSIEKYLNSNGDYVFSFRDTNGDNKYDYVTIAGKEDIQYAYASYIMLTGKADDYTGAHISFVNSGGENSTLEFSPNVKVYSDNIDGQTINIQNESRGAFETEYTGSVDYSSAASEDAQTGIVINEMIACKTGDDGKIKEIAIGYENITKMIGSSKAANYMETGTDYNPYSRTFGDGDIINNSTVIFSLNTTPTVGIYVDAKDISVVGADALTGGENYKAELYNISLSKNVGCMFGIRLANRIDWESPFFVVARAVDTELNDEDVVMLTGYQGGELVNYYVDSKSYVTGTIFTLQNSEYASQDESNLYGEYTKGQVMLVNADADGVIRTAAVIGNMTSYEDATEVENVDLTNIYGDDDGRLVTGFVCGTSGSKVYIGAQASDPDENFLDTYDGNNIYVCDTSTLVTVYDFTAASTNTIMSGDTSDICRGDFVFARVDDNDRIKEVIVIINTNTYNY